MDADDDATPGPDRAGPDRPLTVELLADLQAGALDDDTAAQVRKQVREDPAAADVLAALNRVRRDVAALGDDPRSAPDPPPHLGAKVAAAVRAAGPAGPTTGEPPTHSARPVVRPSRVAAAVAGLGAVLAAIGVGTVALMRAPGPAPSTPDTAELITVSTPPMAIPLTQGEIQALLGHPPDYGPLADPARRASCLTGLGYPAATEVLGARPIEINARPGVVLVVAADTPRTLAVYAVAPSCSAADTGLLANTQVPRP